MFSSAELIEALRRRQRWSLRPGHTVGEFPPGWHAWFVALRERMGTISGATADAIVALMLQREPRRVPPRMPALNDWQAFATLWRQQWHPVTSDKRGQRIVAMVVAALSQLFIAIFLLWVGYAPYAGAPREDYGEDVVQVEFIGVGTPEEQGGGDASGPEPEPQRRAAEAEPAAAPAPSPVPAPAPAQPAPRSPVPDTRITEVAAPTAPVAAPVERPELARPQPPVASEQPLQVTEAPPEVDTPFVLPPPVPHAIDVPSASVEVPELASTVQSIEIPEAPVARASPRQVRLPEASVAVPELQSGIESLPTPGPPLQGATARTVDLPTAAITIPGLAAEPGALPVPARAGAGASGESGDAGQGSERDGATATAGTQGTGADGSSVRDGGDAVVGTGGGQAEGDNAGAGPEPASPPGAWATTQPGDDWGLSDRNRPGGQAGSGLFDESGRPRLPPGVKPEAGGGLPPGTVTADIQDLDREGTWLKRPPIGYDPTRFDRYWLPGGNLLEEWVRRGIREVSIAIPGTGKRINCVVSLLALGGACGVDDPDMQDQEAEARPPPDIPWKPGLQENQDAL